MGGGSRYDRRTSWLPLFNETDLVLFTMNIASFCQILDPDIEEESEKNAFQEQLELLEVLKNLPWFGSCAFQLILTKTDLFKKRFYAFRHNFNTLFSSTCRTSNEALIVLRKLLISKDSAFTNLLTLNTLNFDHLFVEKPFHNSELNFNFENLHLYIKFITILLQQHKVGFSSHLIAHYSYIKFKQIVHPLIIKQLYENLALNGVCKI